MPTIRHTINDLQGVLTRLHVLGLEVEELIKELTFSQISQELRAIGLFEGIEHSTPNPSFLDRLLKHAEGKFAMAKYLMLNPGPAGSTPFRLAETIYDEPRRHSRYKSVFFEAGSTIAYVVGAYAKALRAAHSSASKVDDPLSINLAPGAISGITNNLFALTALADLVDSISPVPGESLTKYYGFFPFSDKPDGPQVSSSEAEEVLAAWLDEARNWTALSQRVRECDVVFATCSNFSFLAGPLVGSRANALAKHAILSGSVGGSTEAILLLDFSKLVPISDAPERIKSRTRIELSAPTENCFCVFPISKNLRSGFRGARRSFDQGSWHASWWSKPKTAICRLAEKSMLFKGMAGTIDGAAWLEKCPGLRVLIGLPDNSDVRSACHDVIKQECRLAETICPGLKFQVLDLMTARDYGVVEVVIDSRDISETSAREKSENDEPDDDFSMGNNEPHS